MIILRKPGSRTMSPRILELAMPTDSGPGQKTLKLEGGTIILSKRLRVLSEYTREIEQALASGFRPVRQARTCTQDESAEERQLTLRVNELPEGMGVSFAADTEDE